MAIYESEHTKFIKELKAKTPGMEERQVEGRALLCGGFDIGVELTNCSRGEVILYLVEP